jgi:hypothetical protein
MTKLLTVVVLIAAVWGVAAMASVSAMRRSPHVVPGTYCGITEQERRVCLRTSARARAVVAFRSWSTVDCTTGVDASPVQFLIPLGVSGGAIPILRSRAFRFARRSAS